MVDDSHLTGFFGATGGTPDECGVTGRVDIVTSTLGKALGGASGGFTASRREVVVLPRQRSRPYLFSNTLPPALVCASLRWLRLLTDTTTLRDRIDANTRWLRRRLPYPVVLRDQAQIRIQISAAHERAHLAHAVEAFVTVGRARGVIH